MRYFLDALKHKWFILLASFKVGLPLWRAIIHDLNKFRWSVMKQYNRHFYGDKGDEPGYAVAWLHHQNRNPHHWEYWIMRNDTTAGKSMAVSGCLPMPAVYVKEMVVDWMGSEIVHTGSWDMTVWLRKNLRKLKVHPKTMDRIIVELKALGYDNLRSQLFFPKIHYNVRNN